MSYEKKSVNLRSVSKHDYQFLFMMLKERKPEVNISHKKMPTYRLHIKFIKSKPYSKWYIIEYRGHKVGNIYLSKHNEVGIFIKNEWQGNSIGQKALYLLIEKNPRSRYLANVNPKNTKSIRFFKKNGFRLLQHTYELIINFK